MRLVIWPIAILIILLFSKYAYTASFTSFYTFFLMGKFGVSIQTSQMMLFLFLASSVAGALVMELCVTPLLCFWQSRLVPRG